MELCAQRSAIPLQMPSRSEHAGVRCSSSRRQSKSFDSTRVNFSVAHGPAVRSILLQAQKLDADLIVAGKQGRSAISGFLLGCVSRRVLVESDRGVLIVPRPRDISMPRAASKRSAGRRLHVERIARRCRRPVLMDGRTSHEPCRRVLVPVDFSPWSATAITLVLQVASRVTLILMHLTCPP